MPKKTTWVKPNGKEIKINDTDASIEAAIENGWKTKKMIADDEKKAKEEAKIKAEADEKAKLASESKDK